MSPPEIRGSHRSTNSFNDVKWRLCLQSSEEIFRVQQQQQTTLDKCVCFSPLLPSSPTLVFNIYCTRDLSRLVSRVSLSTTEALYAGRGVVCPLSGFLWTSGSCWGHWSRWTGSARRGNKQSNQDIELQITQCHHNRLYSRDCWRKEKKKSFAAHSFLTHQVTDRVSGDLKIKSGFLVTSDEMALIMLPRIPATKHLSCGKSMVYPTTIPRLGVTWTQISSSHSLRSLFLRRSRRVHCLFPLW